MENWIFEQDFCVRDYECDLQSVVNNSVYMNYLEHSRHQFLKSIGFDFAELTEQGIYAMVYKAELEYKKSLRSGDEFTVKIRYEKQGYLKTVFHQHIYLKGTNILMLKGKVTTVIIKNGKPIPPDAYLDFS